MGEITVLDRARERAVARWNPSNHSPTAAQHKLQRFKQSLQIGMSQVLEDVESDDQVK